MKKIIEKITGKKKRTVASIMGVLSDIHTELDAHATESSAKVDAIEIERAKLANEAEGHRTEISMARNAMDSLDALLNPKKVIQTKEA